jgi:hypothetical protein
VGRQVVEASPGGREGEEGEYLLSLGTGMASRVAASRCKKCLSERTGALLETPSLTFVGGMISVSQGNGQDHITLVSSPAESCRPWADLDPRVLDL